MIATDIQFGHFPESDRLQPRFRPGSRRMRIHLQSGFTYAPPMPIHTPPLSLFYGIFPGLKDHSCGETFQGAGEQYVHQPAGQIVTLSRSIDIVHYMEHMILDLLFQLGSGEPCSGVTGKLKGVDEFIMYVECSDERLGRFALNYAMALVHQAIFTGKIDPRYGSALAAASMDHAGNERKDKEAARDRAEEGDYFARRVLSACGLSAGEASDGNGGRMLIVCETPGVAIPPDVAGTGSTVTASVQASYAHVAEFTFDNVLLPEPQGDLGRFVEWTLDVQPQMRIVHHASVSMPAMDQKFYRYDIRSYAGP